MRVAVVKAGRDPVEQLPYEVVERKGIGHPDTLADGLAEEISREYSRHCVDRFGRVANHWIDKCVVIGGESDIAFGRGELVRPYRVLVVGKLTWSVGDETIPVEALATEAVHRHLGRCLRGFDPQRHVRVELAANDAVGAGRPSRWYRPTHRDDLPQPEQLSANDAVVCSAYAPMSRTERLVLGLEQALTGGELAEVFPEIGTDVKVLAVRDGRRVEIVACVPFLASRTPSRAEYDRRKCALVEAISRYAARVCPEYRTAVRLNTRDDAETTYLTALGSAADTGDVGVVGRGNRANGLITPMRPMSIEAAAGKNPTYHAGKLYSVLSQQIADEVAERTGRETYVHITSSTGRPLTQPDTVVAELVMAAGERIAPEPVEAVIDAHTAGAGGLVNHFLKGATLW